MVRRRQGPLHSCHLLIQAFMVLTGKLQKSGALSLLLGQVIYPKTLPTCSRAREGSCISTSKKCSVAEVNLRRESVPRSQRTQGACLGERRREKGLCGTSVTSPEHQRAAGACYWHPCRTSLVFLSIKRTLFHIFRDHSSMNQKPATGEAQICLQSVLLRKTKMLTEGSIFLSSTWLLQPSKVNSNRIFPIQLNHLASESWLLIWSSVELKHWL